MKLSADDQGRLTSPQLFRPKATFDATVQPDGSIRLMEVTERSVPIVRPRRINGRLRGADISVTPETVAAAVRADRDAR
jgi:hypothetical protein